MSTPKQIAFIEDMLNDLGWNRDDIGSEIGEDYRDYEDLDVLAASELIDELKQRRYRLRQSDELYQRRNRRGGTWR